ncbi:unnamed protein product, partial [Linum tenue]
SAKGTIRSLILQEIRYLSQLQSSSRDSPDKDQSSAAGTAAAGTSQSRSVVQTRKKKKKGGSRLLPSICSMVDVSDKNHFWVQLQEPGNQNQEVTSSLGDTLG